MNERFVRLYVAFCSVVQSGTAHAPSMRRWVGAEVRGECFANSQKWQRSAS